MNLLIVDDEILAVQGLQDDIPWETLHFDRVLTANSYAQAVNLFMENRIDILLCDIEMPYGNGVELVKWVKEHFPAVECIFLTCHDNFEFARKAIEMQCLGYLLKPADTKDVVRYLQKAEQKLLRAGESQIYQDYGRMYLDHIKESPQSFSVKAMNEKVENYIHAHIAEDISREELAQMVHLSPTHFSRLFKKKHNMTLVDYITQQRILLAKELLKQEEITISAVAAKVGYGNYSYFAKTFRKYTGKTPREYHQEIAFGKNQHRSRSGEGENMSKNE